MLKPRICFVIPSLGVGGTERQLLYLLKGLQEFYEITVVCTKSEGVWAEDARRMADVKMLGLRGGWDPRLKSNLRKLFEEYRPVVVHSFMFGFDYTVNVAARGAGIPVVISSRRQLATWKKPRHIRLQKKANGLADAIVANSRSVAEYAAEQEGARVEDFLVILNGIDVKEYQSQSDVKRIAGKYDVPDDKKVIGIVANFSPVKDHLLFLSVARELLHRRSDLYFVMVGRGLKSDTISEMLCQHGVEDSVTSISVNSELEEVYRLIDVLVLTSKSEGFPNVVMEAMASGTPVVAADVGGVPELIRQGETGSLIDGRDPKRYADAIEYYVDCPDAAKAVTEAALAYVTEHLSIDTMVSGYRDVYERLLADKAESQSE